MMHSERKSSPGTLSKSCMLSGCLILLVIFLICGGILAYLMYQDDEKESRSILNSIETPEGIANVEGISGVSLSEDGEASSENAKEGLPIGKEYINKDLERNISTRILKSRSVFQKVKRKMVANLFTSCIT